MLVGTAHGQTLENLMKNPTLSDLIGGIQTVTLSDAEAADRGTRKTVQERRGAPPFDILIEMRNRRSWIVHRRVADSVDPLLNMANPTVESRHMDDSGEVAVEKVLYKGVNLSDEEKEARPYRPPHLPHFPHFLRSDFPHHSLCSFYHSSHSSPYPQAKKRMEQELASLLSNNVRGRRVFLNGTFPSALIDNIQRCARRIVAPHPQMWEGLDVMLEGVSPSPYKKQLALIKQTTYLDLKRFCDHRRY